MQGSSFVPSGSLEVVKYQAIRLISVTHGIDRFGELYTMNPDETKCWQNPVLSWGKSWSSLVSGTPCE